MAMVSRSTYEQLHPPPEPTPTPTVTARRSLDLEGGVGEGVGSSVGGRAWGARKTLSGRVEAVEGGVEELLGPKVRSPSVQKDLSEGMNVMAASRAQRLRAQLRELEAELAEARAKLGRGAALRGLSGARYVCDGEMLVGGCERTVFEDEGVLCEGCGLFLCHACFGATVVTNEVQVGGRYDAKIDGVETSYPGCLPCPMFPQGCSCASFPLSDIQRALLHPANRGPDGANEDIHSAGHSPHKLHLLARRRLAEESISQDESARGPGGLLRTITEQRVLASIAQAAGTASTRSTVRVLLAEKLDELEHLQSELRQHPPEDAIPLARRRTCAQCCGSFADVEGAQCHPSQDAHFLCNLCFGQYVMRACSDGGCYERELCDSDGKLCLPGQLPCALWRGHVQDQLEPFVVRICAELQIPDKADVGFTCDDNLVVRQAVENGQAAVAGVSPGMRLHQFMREDLPVQNYTWHDLIGEVRRTPKPWHFGFSASPQLQRRVVAQRDCEHAAIPLATVDRVMLDPRNCSPPFWRVKLSSEIILSQTESFLSLNETSSWTGRRPLGGEILHKELCPSSVHETARFRVVWKETNREDNGAAVQDPLGQLRLRVLEALNRGASIQCPKCGVKAEKDDACVHMKCACGCAWCFLCGRQNGGGKGYCPQGEGGCDESRDEQGGCYLENHLGWTDCATPGEMKTFGKTSAGRSKANAIGAQKELLRRRQAFLVRLCKEEADRKLWGKLREKFPNLLDGVPTDDRRICWDELDHAELPLFGANLRNNVDGRELLGLVDFEGEERSKQNFAEYWERERIRGEELARHAELMGYVKLLGPALVYVGLVVLVVLSQMFVDDIAETFHELPSNSTTCSTTSALLVATAYESETMTTTLLSTSSLDGQSVAPVRRIEAGRLVWQQPDLMRVNITIVQSIDKRMRSVEVVPYLPPVAVFIDGYECPKMTFTDNGTRSWWIEYRDQMLQDAHAEHLLGAVYRDNESWSTPPLCVNSTCIESKCTVGFLCNASCDIIFWLPVVCSSVCALLLATVTLCQMECLERMAGGERQQLLKDSALGVLFSLGPVLVSCHPHYVVVGDWFVVRILAGVCVFLIANLVILWLGLVTTAAVMCCRAACCCCCRGRCWERCCRVLSCCKCGGCQLALAMWAGMCWQLAVDNLKVLNQHEVELTPLLYCTWPCVAHQVLNAIGCVLALVTLAEQVIRDYDTQWRHNIVGVGALAVQVSVTTGLPVLLFVTGGITAEELATGPAEVHYFLGAICTYLGFAATLSEHHLLRRMMSVRMNAIFQAWDLDQLISLLACGSSVWLLWVYRHSASTSKSSRWAQTVFWQALWIYCTAHLVGTYIHLFSPTIINEEEAVGPASDSDDEDLNGSVSDEDAMHEQLALLELDTAPIGVAGGPVAAEAAEVVEAAEVAEAAEAAEAVDAAQAAATPIAAARSQAEQVRAMAVDGHPNNAYNNAFEPAGVHNGWPRYRAHGDCFMFRDVASEQWVFSYSTLATDDLDQPATIHAPDGPVPTGQQVWLRGDEEVRITVVELRTLHHVEQYNFQLRAVRREAEAEAAEQNREMVRRIADRDREDQMYNPARQHPQPQVPTSRRHRLARSVIWHALVIWPLCIGDDTLAHTSVCGAVILSLQLAFLMTCQRALSRFREVLFVPDAGTDAEAGAKTVRLAAVCVVAASAVCIQFGINLTHAPLWTPNAAVDLSVV